MPRFEYQCGECGFAFEMMRSRTEFREPVPCVCGGAAQYVFTPSVPSLRMGRMDTGDLMYGAQRGRFNSEPDMLGSRALRSDPNIHIPRSWGLTKEEQIETQLGPGVRTERQAAQIDGVELESVSASQTHRQKQDDSAERRDRVAYAKAETEKYIAARS